MEITDQVRQAASIVEIASQYTSLQRRGKKHIGLCPFHSEKTPSFTVDEDKQLFHCFGCGAGGDVFSLVMDKESLSFPEALRFLADKYNIRLPEKKSVPRRQLRLEEQLSGICEQALALFRKNLFNTQEGQKALAYLKGRGVSEEAAQTLKLGYAMNSWDGLLRHFQNRDTSPPLLEKAGLVLKRQNKEGYYDRFRGRIIFPIFTLTGKVVAFGGRTVIDADPKYLNSPETPLYNKGDILYGLNFTKSRIREDGELILVEGYMDFLIPYQAGLANIAASLGTSLTSPQLALIQRFAPRVLIAYDGDSAGRKAAGRAVSLCFEQNLESRVVRLPEGYDPDSYISEFGIEKFRKLMQDSPSGMKFLIDRELARTKADTPEAKSRIARSLLSEVEKIADSVSRSEYLRQVGEALHIDEATLRTMVKKGSAAQKSDARGTFLNAERRLLRALWQEKEIRDLILAEIWEEDHKDLNSHALFCYLTDCRGEDKEPSWSELKQKIPPDVFKAFSGIALDAEPDADADEALDCLYTLRQLALEKMSRELNIQIARLEKQGDREKALALLNAKLDLAKQLTLLSQREECR